MATTELSFAILPHMACWECPLYHEDTWEMGRSFRIPVIRFTHFTDDDGSFFAPSSDIFIETPLHYPCESVSSVDPDDPALAAASLRCVSVATFFLTASPRKYNFCPTERM